MSFPSGTVAMYRLALGLSVNVGWQYTCRVCGDWIGESHLLKTDVIEAQDGLGYIVPMNHVRCRELYETNPLAYLVDEEF